MGSALHTVSIASLWLGIASAAMILADILAGRRQPMAVMNAVWPITGLWAGPLGLWAYWQLGRPRALCASAEHPHAMPDRGHSSRWKSVFVSDTHCGAGCTLGDVAGELLVFATGLTVGGSVLWANYLVDFAFALAVGLAFQYFAIVPMRHLSPGKGVLAAIKADTASLVAFEVGMFAWMAFARFVILKRQVPPTAPEHWFMMQLAMIAGFVTSYPVNWGLVKAGVKEAM